MLSVYTDALYQGHFLLSSILGCHPPLVGHSIFLRSSALQQCGRLRQLRKTQRWLENVGLPFLSVDQVGAGNLLNSTVTEYWSECHVSEDFELMIHLYNLGFDGRYIAYPGCEFQEGITRTFDEEAGRHRKFALGAHELMFNPVNSWIGQGVFSPLFKTFLTCDIPSYYKIFLTAYLLGYTSGGAYILVFVAAAVTRILDRSYEVDYIHAFNSAGVLILSMVVRIKNANTGLSSFAFSEWRYFLHQLFRVLLSPVPPPFEQTVTDLLRDRLPYILDLHGSHVLRQSKLALPRVPKSECLLPYLHEDPVFHVLPIDVLLVHG